MLGGGQGVVLPVGVGQAALSLKPAALLLCCAVLCHSLWEGRMGYPGLPSYAWQRGAEHPCAVSCRVVVLFVSMGQRRCY